MSLERSLWQVTLMGVGVILGAGIYVIIGEAVGLTGNAIWLAFIIGSINGHNSNGYNTHCYRYHICSNNRQTFGICQSG